MTLSSILGVAAELTADVIGNFISTGARKKMREGGREEALQRAYLASLRAMLETLPDMPTNERLHYYSVIASLLNEPPVQSELSKLISGRLPDPQIIIDVFREAEYDTDTIPKFNLEAAITAFASAFVEQTEREPALADMVHASKLRAIIASLQEVDALVATHHRSFVEVRSGNAEVVASGTVFSFNRNSINITFGPLEQRLYLILEFVDNESISGIDVRGENLDANSIKLTFVNFNNPLGIGTKKPVRIGTLNDQPLFLQYRVYSLEAGEKMVNYTIYLER